MTNRLGLLVLSALAAILLIPLKLTAQITIPQIIYVTVAPSGACGATQIDLLTPDGKLYSCQNGTWAQVGGGSSSITPTTCTNQVVTAIASSGAATCNTVTSAYVDSSIAPTASPALTGNPTAPTQAATDNSTKLATTAYVTTGITNAINASAGRDLVTAASNAVLPNTPTYNNGVSGIGATLTSASNVALVVDGYTCVLNDRILVKNQAAAAQNGIYYCSQVGTGILPWILTRALDYDTPSDMNNTIVPVANHGTVNALTSWIMTSTVATVGTDSVTFAAFTPNGANIVTASSPGAGIGHFAGSTQALTSSAVVNSDLNITATTCSAGSYLTAISATGTVTCTAATARYPLWGGSFLASTGSGGGGSGGIWQIGGAAGFTTCARNVTGGVKPETCEVGLTNSASGNGQNISYVFPWDTSITQVDLAFTFFPSGTASGNFRFTGTLICQTLGTLIDSGTWTAGTVNTGATVASLAVALKTQYYTLANINIPTCAVGSPMSLLLLRDNGVGSNTTDEARLATGAIWITKALP